jgi:hypothetical protein
MGDEADPDSDVCSALKKRRRGLGSYSQDETCLDGNALGLSQITTHSNRVDVIQ